MFYSLPLSERTVKATEARLTAIYTAATRGLSGDNLAYAANLSPTELRRLQELDPLARQAEEKGRADAELKMADVVFKAAEAGDAKAAMDFLKHKHKWVATQHVQIDVEQRISITAALEQAQGRIIDIEPQPQPPDTPQPPERIAHAEADLHSGGRADADGPAVVSRDRGRPRKVRPVLLPVGPEEHAP